MLDDHIGYLKDARRQALFEDAVGAAVKDGDSVVDLGCGTGVLGLLALRAGARHVYAIEHSAIIDVARETIERAGFGDKVSFFRGNSLRVDLPERVDVVICDHVGYFGIDYRIIETLDDARRRFLKPAGLLIPAALTLRLAAVETRAGRERVNRWRTHPVPPEFHWLREVDVNQCHAMSFEPEAILGSPASLSTIDFGTDNPDYFRWTADLQISRNGVVDGLAGWFDCDLTAGVRMTNSPLVNGAIARPQSYFPISEPISVNQGEVIYASVQTRPADAMIAWTVEFPATGRSFSHSSWQGTTYSAEAMRRASPMRIPMVGAQNRARMIVMGYCDGIRTAQEIEEVVLEEHPNLLPTKNAIRQHVQTVLLRSAE